MKSFDRNELIDKYILGGFSAEEKAAFDELYANDASFKSSADQRKVLIAALSAYQNRNSLKNILQGFHREIDAADAKHYNTTVRNRIIRLWHGHKSNIAMAASVALIAITTTFALTSKILSDRQKNTYVELSQDLRDIKSYQDVILKNIKGKSTKAAYNPGKYNGTGFAISENGYLITSSHLIKSADSIVVQNQDGDRFRVVPVYKNADYDLAILKIEDDNFTGFSRLPFGFRIPESELGETVFTMGFPRADLVFGEGSLSAQSGYYGDSTAYQISIPLNPGNSGGPLLDNKGNLIGVITGKEKALEGAAFAIKSEFILKALEEMGQDSLKRSLTKKSNALSGLSRNQQIQKMKNLVFEVNVYNN